MDAQTSKTAIKRAEKAEKLIDRLDRAAATGDERHARARERLESRRRELHASLDISEYASGPAGEAWAAMASLLFREGKPRFPTIAAELELSPPQAMVVRMLTAPRSMGELADAMHCDNSNITGIVDRLEERGLVERLSAEHDRRVKLIAATRRGASLREKLNRRLAEPPEAIKRLPAADQRTLRDILRRALATARDEPPQS